MRGGKGHYPTPHFLPHQGAEGVGESEGTVLHPRSRTNPTCKPGSGAICLAAKFYLSKVSCEWPMPS